VSGIEALVSSLKTEVATLREQATKAQAARAAAEAAVKAATDKLTAEQQLRAAAESALAEARKPQ
jgi:hypothetical protein